MDWFSLACCLLLTTTASHIECKSAEKEGWSKNSLVSGAWGQNPKAHGVLSRAWRDLLLNGTLREQGPQNSKGWSKARNILMQHRIGRRKSGELKKLVLSKVRRNQDLLAMQRMGGKTNFVRGKRKKKKKRKREKGDKGGKGEKEKKEKREKR